MEQRRGPEYCCQSCGTRWDATVSGECPICTPESPLTDEVCSLKGSEIMKPKKEVLSVRQILRNLYVGKTLKRLEFNDVTPQRKILDVEIELSEDGGMDAMIYLKLEGKEEPCDYLMVAAYPDEGIEVE
jgi:hypothetical protein